MSLSAGIFFSSVAVAFVLAFGIGANDVANRYRAASNRFCQISLLLEKMLRVSIFDRAALVPQLAAEH